LLRIFVVKALVAMLAVCALVATAGCGAGGDSSGQSTAAAPSEPAALTGKPEVSVPEGAPPGRLEIKDLQEGNGAPVERGDYVTFHYVGVDYETGKQFVSSWGGGLRNFTVGAGEEVPGIEKGIEGMRPGGRRELIVPPGLAYGRRGSPPAIGPNQTLVFVIDLFETSTPPPNSR
jgi:peptidylprolyl isomerase